MMRKNLILLLCLAALAHTRADVTNYVYTYETRYITNRVQNTAYFYYITNNVTTVSNIWTVNHTTNYHYEVVNTNFGPWLAEAAREANRAADGATAATNMANVAAGYATEAGSRAADARASASLAASYRNQTIAYANQGLDSIDGRVSIFNSSVDGLQGRVESLISRGLDTINEQIEYFNEIAAGRKLTNETFIVATNINIHYSQATNVVLDYSTVTNVNISTNVYVSSSTVTNIVLDYTSVTNYTYNTTTNVVVNMNYSITTNLNYSTVVSNTYILPGTGGGSIDLQTLSMPYTATNGTEYANIQYYPLGHANGKACATPTTGQAAALEMFFVPLLWHTNPSYPDGCFDLLISHVDSDAGGMRIHYAATYNQRLIQNYSSGIDFTCVLRDFYWQTGRYYAVVDVYRWSDTNSRWSVIGRYNYRSDIAFTFPNAVNGSSVDTSSSYYARMTIYTTMGSLNPTSQYGYFKTAKGATVPGGAPLWIPAAPSPAQAAAIEWLYTTFPTF